MFLPNNVNRIGKRNKKLHTSTRRLGGQFFVTPLTLCYTNDDAIKQSDDSDAEVK